MSTSFDEILGMLQDDNNRVISNEQGQIGSLQLLEEDGVKTLKLSGSLEPPAREAEQKVTTALSSYASHDQPQVLPSKEYIIEKIGQDSKRYTANFAINLETPENYFGYYSEHFYGNGLSLSLSPPPLSPLATRSNSSWIYANTVYRALELCRKCARLRRGSSGLHHQVRGPQHKEVYGRHTHPHRRLSPPPPAQVPQAQRPLRLLAACCILSSVHKRFLMHYTHAWRGKNNL